MAMRFRGQLDEGVLVNLLQYLNLNRATGVLRLQDHRGVRGDIYTEEGRPVHAITTEREGMRALVALLAWQEGRFAFQSDVGPSKQTLDKPLDALLLHAAYQSDEGAREAPQLSESSVLTPLRPDDGGTGNVHLSLGAIRVLPLLDGKATLKAVRERLGLGSDDVLRAAREIVANGLASWQLSASVPEGLIDELTRVVRDILGPLADIVMEDALYDLNLTPATVPEASLSELLATIEREFPRDDWRASFAQRADALLARYGLHRS